MGNKFQSLDGSTTGVSRDCPRMERGGDVFVAVPKPFQGDENIAAPKSVSKGAV
jgi:hypothetical protein